jgi:N-acyl amino acid synthase of PEP-CTERM/exosortase system
MAPFPFELAVAAAGRRLQLPFAVEDWRQRAGEISRLAVVSQFRRRRNERGRPDTLVVDEAPASPERRAFPHIAIGLYLGAAALGLMRGLDRVFAIMEPRLARRLRACGIEFEPVGEGLEYHGLRVPFVLTRGRFEQGVAPPIRELLDTIRSELVV